MKNKGQSIFEYSILAVFVILAVILMGPYIVRSMNAHFKMWQEAVDDSANDRMTALTTNMNLNVTCNCSLQSGICGGTGHAITCHADEIYQYDDDPANPGCCFANGDTTESCLPAHATCCAQYTACSVLNPTGSLSINLNCCGSDPDARPSTDVPDANGLYDPFTDPSGAKLCYSGEEIYNNNCDTTSIRCKPNYQCVPGCVGIPLKLDGSPAADPACPGTDTNLDANTPITILDEKDCITYNNPGTYTYTMPGNGLVTLTAWGGGGGGAGGSTNTSNPNDGGGGGGGGFVTNYDPTNPAGGATFPVNASFRITIGRGGQGGAGGNNSGGAGSDGQDTTITYINPPTAGKNFTITANKGTGGKSASNGSTNGGAGGSSSCTGSGCSALAFKNIGASAAGGNGGSAAPGKVSGCGGGGAGGLGLPGDSPLNCTSAQLGSGSIDLDSGSGGDGDIDGNGGNDGGTPGAGGGGSSSGRTGGDGATGAVQICQPTVNICPSYCTATKTNCPEYPDRLPYRAKWGYLAEPLAGGPPAVGWCLPFPGIVPTDVSSCPSSSFSSSTYQDHTWQTNWITSQCLNAGYTGMTLLADADWGPSNPYGSTFFSYWYGGNPLGLWALWSCTCPTGGTGPCDPNAKKCLYQCSAGYQTGYDDYGKATCVPSCLTLKATNFVLSKSPVPQNSPAVNIKHWKTHSNGVDPSTGILDNVFFLNWSDFGGNCAWCFERTQILTGYKFYQPVNPGTPYTINVIKNGPYGATSLTAPSGEKGDLLPNGKKAVIPVGIGLLSNNPKVLHISIYDPAASAHNYSFAIVDANGKTVFTWAAQIDHYMDIFFLPSCYECDNLGVVTSSQFSSLGMDATELFSELSANGIIVESPPGVGVIQDKFNAISSAAGLKLNSASFTTTQIGQIYVILQQSPFKHVVECPGASTAPPGAPLTPVKLPLVIDNGCAAAATGNCHFQCSVGYHYDTTDPSNPCVPNFACNRYITATSSKDMEGTSYFAYEVNGAGSCLSTSPHNFGITCADGAVIGVCGSVSASAHPIGHVFTYDNSSGGGCADPARAQPLYCDFDGTWFYPTAGISSIVPPTGTTPNKYFEVSCKNNQIVGMGAATVLPATPPDPGTTYFYSGYYGQNEYVVSSNTPPPATPPVAMCSYATTSELFYNACGSGNDFNLGCSVDLSGNSTTNILQIRGTY